MFEAIPHTRGAFYWHIDGASDAVPDGEEPVS